MTTYTVSYFIKNATTFEEGATVTDVGNGWFRVVKQTGIEWADAPLKPKRKAAWKQNPLNRFRVRSKA
jgi:hypothetical protein